MPAHSSIEAVLNAEISSVRDALWVDQEKQINQEVYIHHDAFLWIDGEVSRLELSYLWMPWKCSLSWHSVDDIINKREVTSPLAWPVEGW